MSERKKTFVFLPCRDRLEKILAVLPDWTKDDCPSHPGGLFHILAFDGGGSRGAMEAQMIKVHEISCAIINAINSLSL